MSRNFVVIAQAPKNPDLPFLAFLDFLAFFVARNFLAFLSVFPFFPRDFRGSEERKSLLLWVIFLAFSKKARKRRSGNRGLLGGSLEIFNLA